MAFDFPNSPTSGQTVNGPGGTQYRFDGTKFVAVAPSGSSMWVPDAAAPWIGPTLTGYLTPAADPRGNYAQFAARRYASPVDAVGHNWDGGVVQVFGPSFSSDGTTVSPQAGGVGIGAGSNATGSVYYWDFWPTGTMTAPGHVALSYTPPSNALANTLFARGISQTSTGPHFWNAYWTDNTTTPPQDSRYINNDYAACIYIGGGALQFLLAPSGTAGASIAWPAQASLGQDGTFSAAGLGAGYIHSSGDIVADGNFSANNITGNWIVSNGDMLTHQMYVDGAYGLKFRNFSGTWIAFGWNGRVCVWLDGGGAYKELRDTGNDYCPNQNVDYNSSPTFWDSNVGGTIYATNGNATHQFSNTHASGMVWCGDLQSNANLNLLNRGQIWSGNIDAYDVSCGNLFGHGKNVSNYGVQAQGFSGDVTGFWYNGSLVVRWNNSWDQACYMQSDARLKAEIADTRFDCLDAILKVKVRQFRWRDMSPRRRQPGFNPGEARGALHRVGIIAQELAEIAPEFAAMPDNNDESDPAYEKQIVHLYGVDHFSVLAALCGAVQKLNERLEAGGL